MTQVAALYSAGSAPARLRCPAAAGCAPDARIVLPRRHWKSTTPRSVTAGLPATGFSSKLVPPWRAEAPLPTATKPELAPLERFTQLLVALSRYCRRKLMYMLSCAWPSPGIEPRMPIVLGWSAGLHTSIVAHSSCECSRARSSVLVFRAFAELVFEG